MPADVSCWQEGNRAPPLQPHLGRVSGVSRALATQARCEAEAYRLGTVGGRRGYPYGDTWQHLCATRFERAIGQQDRYRLCYWHGWAAGREARGQ